MLQRSWNMMRCNEFMTQYFADMLHGFYAFAFVPEDRVKRFLFLFQRAMFLK